jgi:hypothetical protein
VQDLRQRSAARTTRVRRGADDGDGTNGTS